MVEATPTTILRKPVAFDLAYGTARRIVDVHVEVSPAASETVNLATYLPGLTGILAVTGHNIADVSKPTFSGTTLTYVQRTGSSGVQISGVRAYY